MKNEIPTRSAVFAVPLLALLSLLCLGWMLFHVHPGTDAAVSPSRLSLGAGVGQYMNNAASDALGELSYIKKIYTIEESATVAPRPNPAAYGSTDNPLDILALAETAEELLEGQALVFDPEADFFPGSSIRYYLDETILVIAWKEVLEGKVVNCAEVKLAHGSQLRRKLAGDSYGSEVQMKASDMAKQANAVIAINGDFYAFRSLGITAYQRQVYRCHPRSVDSCFFTADGDMLFAYAGQLPTQAEAQQFMDDNNCLFAVAFGPILVDEGEVRWVGNYPLGEIFDTYSRSAIGMTDELHYVLMTINYDEGYTVTSTIYQLADFMHQKNCVKAYALDGGQTAVLVMQGEAINHVDWGIERDMSDIICFATAIPEEEVSP